MAVSDLRRQGKTPSSGSEQGNQSIIDFNLFVDGVLYIPTGATNTLSGGKNRAGAIRFTNGKLNIHIGDNVWVEYVDSNTLEAYQPIVDGLKYVEDITVSGLNVTVVSPVRWRINGINYEKNANTIFNIQPTSVDNNRIDVIYANEDGNILIIQGIQTSGVATEPVIPVDTVKVAPIFISGSIISPPNPDLSLYITKSQADSLYSVISPSGSYIQASPVDPQDATIKINQEATIVTEGLSSGWYVKKASDNNITGVLSYNALEFHISGNDYTSYAKDLITFVLNDGYKQALKPSEEPVAGNLLLTLPKATGIIPVTVNGIFADENGNIIVPTGGGGGGGPYSLEETTAVGNTTDDRIGLGTSSPRTKLHIYSTEAVDGLTIDGSAFPAITLRIDDVVKGYAPFVNTQDGSFFNDSLVGDMGFRSESNRILFGVGGGFSQMQVSSSGVSMNVGKVVSDPVDPTDIARLADITSALGVTINTTNANLNLDVRGYYNYNGSIDAIWNLPATPPTGRFYRIYNQGIDTDPSLTVNAGGSDMFFRGGTTSDNILLMYGENLTVQWSGLYWNVYSN